MSISVRTRVDFSGDRDLFTRVAKAFRNRRTLMGRIGALGAESARIRLRTQLSTSQTPRTGHLMASLEAGNPDNVFEVTDLQAIVGTNVRYAAQRQYGGIIEPKPGKKALAIPLVPYLQRHGMWPSEVDPSREILQFVPYTGAKPNIVGLLINPAKEDEPLQFQAGRKRREPAKPRGSIAFLPAGPIYALAYWVSQPARPFMYWDENDLRAIREDIVPGWLAGK